MNLNKLVILFTVLILGCKTEEPQNPPTVITNAASNITFRIATLTGEVTNEGFSAASDRGFVYNEKNSNPSVSDSKAQSGYGKGVYSKSLDNLLVNTKYYFKAYASNTKGTSYGEVQSFTTGDYKLPTLVTELPKNITYTTVELNGVISDEGAGTITESGFVVGINPSPTTADMKFPISNNNKSIALVITNLKENNKYFIRSYAINEKGIAYGNEQNFTTIDFKLPTITTNVTTEISYFSAIIEGVVIEKGGLPIFERGICFSLNPNPTILDSVAISKISLDSYKVNLDYLKDNSRYYIRAYAKNSKGVGYGNQQSIITKDASKGLRDDYTKIVEVKSKTGRIWMDRNLGASQVATSQTDEKAYGDLYQWSRRADGHQSRNSSLTTKVSRNDEPLNGSFITNASIELAWRSPQSNNMWQGVNGKNNPCPEGYRLPTASEWDTERISWGINNNSDGAFASPLKLTMAGYRDSSDGSLVYLGVNGYYWNSTITGFNPSFITFFSSNAGIVNGYQAFGYSLRCIKD